MTDILSIIKCPVCGGKLKRIEKSLVCENRHSFDVAKQGYVNLLPPGKEKNARTGDEQLMVKARVDFLSGDYYSPISEKFAELIAEHMPEEETVVLCDMGSGEGYHTCNITSCLAKLKNKPVLSLGFDASKHGAVYASRLARSKGMMSSGGIGEMLDADAQAYFMPANIFHLPVRDHSVSVAVSMFAPIAWDEVLRILKPGGILAVVASGREHLMEMRKLIYDDVHISEFDPVSHEGFSEICRDRLTYKTEIQCNDDIRNLFVMTPFYYKTTEAGRERLYSQEKLDITLDTNYMIFKVE
ncbi:MAG: hypothetical protein E7627_03345 [Ruminococcaceae bacterium]|nr:hypothetical protein [Oscillospiraceae bacterium]